MNNVHVITGGGSGIGLECAKQFKDGVVVITGIYEEELKSSKIQLESLGLSVEYKISDISSPEDIKELIAYAKSLGKLKTVVNSAGVSGDQANAKKLLEINLRGTQYLIDALIEAESTDVVIIPISSFVGHLVPDNDLYNSLLENPNVDGNIEKLVEIVQDDSSQAYNFSKKGVHQLVRKYALELGLKQCRIVSVSPGIIMTPMAELAAKDHPETMEHMRSITPAQRNGKPEDISNVVRFLASDDASFITGTDITVDGGLIVEMSKANQQ